MGLDSIVSIADNPAMKDVESLIEEAGGVMALAAIAGVARTTVLDWRTKGYIPGVHAAVICEALKLAPGDVLKLLRPKNRNVPEAAE